MRLRIPLAAGALAVLASGCGGHRPPPSEPLEAEAPVAQAAEASPQAAATPMTVEAGAEASPGMEEDQPPPGVFHRVLPGQTLFTIARTYGVPLEEVAAANGIDDPARIEAGSLLLVPGVLRAVSVPITVPGAPGAAPSFVFPVQGAVGSRFGPRNGRMHYGLDIGAPTGSPVRAAGDGVVLYAGNQHRGYGKLVILEHEDGFRTLYAHNSRLRTRPGRRVHAGDVIAEVGATGNATGPHLHFEIRVHDAAIDPLPHLASDARSSQALR